MSAGGVFKLICNDGKADRMINATELLNKRIKDVMCMRSQKGLADPTPTLLDIERTHILFVNAHFKPFAAIGYEYNKVQAQSGALQYGGTVLYSIPQFGDFFNDMVAHVKADAVSASTWAAGDIPAFPAYIGADDQALAATSSVSATENAADNVYTTYRYEYVNLNGDVVNRATATGANFVRYCEYPGQRLFKTVKFQVNGNPLDEYTSEAVMFHQKFRVAPGKQTGWKRLVGQEVPTEAYSDLSSVSGASAFGAAHSNLTNVSSAAAIVSPVNASLTTRRLDTVVHGPQTPKATQPALDMWIPTLFWFNLDSRLSVPSVSIPYGQRFITVELEVQSKIVFTAAGNLFLQLTTEVFNNTGGVAGSGGDGGGGQAITAFKSYKTREPVVVPTSTVSTTQGFSKLDLYINNIFVNPEIHDIYIKRIGFSLIRVYRFQSSPQSASSSVVLLSSLKWPVETIYAGLRPAFNVAPAVRSGLGVTSGNVNEWRDWHRLTRLNDRVCHNVATTESILPTGNADATAIHAGAFALGAFHQVSQVETSRSVMAESTRTLDTIAIKAHGVEIYQSIGTEFFASYQPYTYGGYNVITPEDDGAIMINFCLYPGTYQVSGHINLSRAREFYLSYTSSFVGAADNNDPLAPAAARADLLVLAIAINFLLISDGSAVLRYST